MTFEKREISGTLQQLDRWICLTGCSSKTALSAMRPSLPSFWPSSFQNFPVRPNLQVAGIAQAFAHQTVFCFGWTNTMFVDDVARQWVKEVPAGDLCGRLGLFGSPFQCLSSVSRVGLKRIGHRLAQRCPVKNCLGRDRLPMFEFAPAEMPNSQINPFEEPNHAWVRQTFGPPSS